jgi:hypothetical protein
MEKEQKHRIKEIRETFKILESTPNLLSENSIYFVKSLRKYFEKHKVLSEKQYKILLEIKNSREFKNECSGLCAKYNIR